MRYTQLCASLFQTSISRSMLLIILVFSVLTLDRVADATPPPSFTSDVAGNFRIATDPAASIMLNEVDIVALVLSLQDTVHAMQVNISALQATVKTQHDIITALVSANTTTQASIANQSAGILHAQSDILHLIASNTSTYSSVATLASWLAGNISAIHVGFYHRLPL